MSKMGKNKIPSRVSISPFGLDKNNTSQACSNTTGFCSPWVYCGDNGECKCGATPKSQNFKCDNLSILSTNCLTYNDTENQFETGRCLYMEVKVRLTLPRSISKLNEFVCGKHFNRRGTLCGHCKVGYYPQAYGLCQMH